MYDLTYTVTSHPPGGPTRSVFPSLLSSPLKINAKRALSLSPFGEECFSLWSLCMGTKEHIDQRFRVFSPTMITWPPSSKEATVNWSAGRKLLAFHGEPLWLPRNSPLTSFTWPRLMLSTVLWEILYLAISSCTFNESILFSPSLKLTTLHCSSPQTHLVFL